MNPLKRLLYYESWREDFVEQHDFARSYAILTGSFANIEMAQNMISHENPDYASTEEDFDESTKIVMQSREAHEKKKKRRRRRRRRVVNG